MDSSWNYDILAKILIVGDSGTGKSSLLVRYSDDEYHDNQITTIGVDFKIHTKQLDDGRILKAQLWDSAGQEAYSSIVSSFYRLSHGVMIVFDLTREKSFKNVTKWLNQIKDKVQDNIPIVLVGNKSDLTHKRVVDREVIEQVATQLKLPYIETSAKDSTNVTQAFDLMIQRVIDSQSYLENKKRIDEQPLIPRPKDEEKKGNVCCFK